MILGIVGRSVDRTGALCSLGTGKDTVADHYVTQERFQKIGLADPLKRFCMEVYGFTAEQLWGASEHRNKPDKRYPRKHSWEVQTHHGKSSYLCACCGAEMTDIRVKHPPCYLTPRFALQQLGTQWGRYMWDDTWIRKGVDTAQALLRDSDYMMYTPQERLVERIERCPNGEFERDDAPKDPPEGVVFSDIRFQNEVKHLKAEGGTLILVYREVDKVAASAKDMAHQSENDLNGFGVSHSLWDFVIQNDRDVVSLKERASVVLETLRE